MSGVKNPAAVELGRRGGAVSSVAKTEAAQRNGLRGGRPRAKLPCEQCGKPTLLRDRSRRPRCSSNNCQT